MSQRKAAAKRLLKYSETPFEAIDISKAPTAPKWCTRAFRNNRYHLTINDNAMTTHGKAIRVMVQNHLDEPIRFHWREMQRIKNEIFGEETFAVEYLPAETQLINDHNIYWFWVFPEGVLPIPIYD